MQHLGWLHAVPEGAKTSRSEQYKAIDENHTMLELPDIEHEHAAGYLIGLLYEAGLMSSSGMGPVPISWVEIDAWLKTTEMSITVWERAMIKKLSEAYVSELSRATEKTRQAPYSKKAEEEFDRVAIGNQIYNVLQGFMKRSAVVNEEDEEAK